MTPRRHVGPVWLIDRAGGDPADKEVLLLSREPVVAFRRRHDHIGVGLPDPGNQLAFVRFARHDCPQAAVEFGDGSLANIKPQPSLPVMLVGPMTGDAVV